MDFTPAEYKEFLAQAFTDEVLKALLLAVIDGYRVAPAAVKKILDLPDRHDGLGMARRGKLNEQLRGVADFHKLGMRDESNSNGSSFFLSIFSGRYRLVAGLVGRRKQMIRPAKIRRLWARHNRDAQGTLGYIPSPPPIPEDAQFLALLIHGPRGRHRDQPAFVDIVVPDLRFTKYMCRIELFARFPQIASDMLTRRDPTVRREPKERKRRKAEGA
jgi:hypothetical protein